MTAFSLSRDFFQAYTPLDAERNGNNATFGGSVMQRLLEAAWEYDRAVGGGADEPASITIKNFRFKKPMITGKPLDMLVEQEGPAIHVRALDEFYQDVAYGSFEFTGDVPQAYLHRIYELLGAADILAGIKLNHTSERREGHVYVTHSVPFLKIENFEDMPSYLNDGVLFKGNAAERHVVSHVFSSMAGLAYDGRVVMRSPQDTERDKTFSSDLQLTGKTGRPILSTRMWFKETPVRNLDNHGVRDELNALLDQIKMDEGLRFDMAA